MTRSINSVSPQNNTGAIKRVGNTQDGRVLYQVLDGEGNIAGKLSVASQHSDTFESCYNTIEKGAIKIQDYQKNTSPRTLEKKKNYAKLVKWVLPLAGFLVPAFCVNIKSMKSEFWKEFIQWGSALVGTVAGFIGGQMLGSKITMPKGAVEVAKATQTLQKLDVVAYQ